MKQPGSNEMTRDELKSQPRATFRVYGQPKIDRLNAICEARDMRPSELVSEWIVDVYDDMERDGWFK